MKEYVKQNNNLDSLSTIINIVSTLPQSANEKDIVLIEGDGVYYYNNSAWEKILNFDVGESVPVGEIKLARYGSQRIYNDSWLECNGSQFDTTKYPALYSLLGTDHLPDLREVFLVGIGQNGTNSIGNHDVFTLGQLKQRALQNHYHSVSETAHNHTVTVTACPNHSHSCVAWGNCTTYMHGILPGIGIWGGVPASTNRCLYAANANLTFCSCTINNLSVGNAGSTSQLRTNAFGVKYYIKAK